MSSQGAALTISVHRTNDRPTAACDRLGQDTRGGIMRKIAVVGGTVAIALAGTAGSLLAVVTAHQGAPKAPARVSQAGQLANEPAPVVATASDDTGSVEAAAGPSTSDSTSSGSSSSTTEPAGRTGTSDAGSASVGSSSTRSSATGSGTGACGEGRWPATVQGAPADFAGGERAGDYLWHTAEGFHLRITHRGDRRDAFTGTIHSDTAIALLPIRLEGHDAVALSANRRTLSYRFYDYGHIDGIKFVTNCATSLTLTGLTADGHALPATRVYLGRARTHPATIPAVLTRN
jgi:hypothetical protein